MSLSPYEPTAYAEPYQPKRNHDLMAWAIQAAEVHKIGQGLAKTSFVPAPLRGKPDEITAQILFGHDLNLPPMIALQQIHLIDGRPAMSALAMRGLAQSNGVKFRYDEMTETRCRISAMAPGDTDWTPVLWTIDRAKKLGLTGKSNWTKQPQNMLIARATAEVCRLVAAPLFLGMAYSTEELQDGVSDVAPWAETPAPEPAPKTTRTVKRDPVKATAVVGEERKAPEVKSEPAPNLPSTLTPVTDTTRKALVVTFNKIGLTERETKLAYVSDLLKREVGSVNEITEEEGLRILNQLHLDYPHETKHVDEWDDAKVAEVPA